MIRVDGGGLFGILLWITERGISSILTGMALYKGVAHKRHFSWEFSRTIYDDSEKLWIHDFHSTLNLRGI
jgi:hypothetical protein